ncbi:MAG: DegT/DnrJ/EryC1/StrS aminotransferase family protein [Candidatus Rokubacteria bacterium]|nr:DegT/DnrJ/EryC1/StrS aminotransferase family protein [Candidatus Rokubacteria bacterium]
MKISAAPIWFPDDDRREILAAIDEVLRSGQLTLGRHGQAFEEEFAKFVGVRHAIAVNSGTSSLEIIFRALGLDGGEVVVPTNTFVATAAAVIHAGGRVRFADVDPSTLCLDAQRLETALTPATKGVVVVHIGGMIAPDMERIQRVCREHGLWLVEDAAHAQGATYLGRQAGAFGVAGSFSFYPTKVMTSGEGGMIVTDDDRIAEEARIYRDQGKAGFYANVHTRLGYNWRMSEIHAIVGLSQLRRLPEFIDARRRVAAVYDKELAAIDGIEPLIPPRGSYANYYKYVAFLRRPVDRAQLKKTLREAYGVPLTGEVYELPCHKQPVFEALAKSTLPDAEAACAAHVCLPVSPRMTVEEAAYAAASLREALRR